MSGKFFQMSGKSQGDVREFCIGRGVNTLPYFATRECHGTECQDKILCSMFTGCQPSIRIGFLVKTSIFDEV